MSLGSLSKRRLWICVAMIVAIVGSFAVACGGGDTSKAEAVIQKMLDAMEAKDADAFIALMDPVGLQIMEEEGLSAEAYKQMLAQEMTYDSMEFEGVKTSINNLRTFPCVQILESKGRLELHGAHFDIGAGVLSVLDHGNKQFRAL